MAFLPSSSGSQRHYYSATELWRNNASIFCHDLRWRTTMASDDISMESSELKRQKMDSDDGCDVITEERIRLRDGSRAQQEEISKGLIDD
ncbi:hypothetical protein NL676_019683 [Syzygium grande]|nr:hypothetical protein NL676_019683 [Syzygium grande]